MDYLIIHLMRFISFPYKINYISHPTHMQIPTSGSKMKMLSCIFANKLCVKKKQMSHQQMFWDRINNEIQQNIAYLFRDGKLKLILYFHRITIVFRKFQIFVALKQVCSFVSKYYEVFDGSINRATMWTRTEMKRGVYKRTFFVCVKSIKQFFVFVISI